MVEGGTRIDEDQGGDTDDQDDLPPGHHGPGVPTTAGAREIDYQKVGRSGRETDLLEKKRCTTWTLVATVCWPVLGRLI